ncbi:small ubiquitin-related modifier 1-like [Forsythia ovata]
MVDPRNLTKQPSSKKEYTIDEVSPSISVAYKRTSCEGSDVKMSTPGQEEDKKPGDQSVHINLKVKGQDGNEVLFRIKRSTQLKKLMNAYCERQSVDFNSIAFLFDGRRLRAEQTPDELEMEDGDEIDAMLHQTGGAAAAAR